MGRYLITGLGGSGKSKICELLKEHGFFALDGDEIDGLSRWEDAKSGKPIKVDHTKYVDYEKVAWNWSPAILKKLVSDHSQLFLCGSSSNEFEFIDLFDKVFVLMLDQSAHEHRLKTRQSDYGKDPKTFAWLVAERTNFVNHAIKLGAISIDANRSPEDTVDQIISYTDEHPRLA